MSESPKRANVFSRIRRDRLESPRHRPKGKGRRDGGVFNRLGSKGKSVSARSENRDQGYYPKIMKPFQRDVTMKEHVLERHYHEGKPSRGAKTFLESEDNEGGHWNSRSKKQKSSIEDDDLSQPWVCEEIDPFTPRIHYFELPKKTRMPSNVKTYDGSDNPEDHLKNFQAAAKVEHWAMPTWCHMFNSTITGSARVWFDDLPPESIDSYDDLKKSFLENYLQQKKCIKDPVEIHHIKQREESLQKISCKGTSPITWCSQKQTPVALSSCEAEFIAATTAACQAIWRREVLAEVTGNEQVIVEHVLGENQRADPLTKALARIRFKEIRSLLGAQELTYLTQKFRGDC
nr:reverse transcriptase domain-containing protein [Tanacetum cinerariifolium]